MSFIDMIEMLIMLPVDFVKTAYTILGPIGSMFFASVIIFAIIDIAHNEWCKYKDRHHMTHEGVNHVH